MTSRGLGFDQTSMYHQRERKLANECTVLAPFWTVRLQSLMSINISINIFHKESRKRLI